MQFLMDIIMSLGISSMLIVSVMAMNDAIFSEIHQSNYERQIQIDLVELAVLFDYDFRKMGYAVDPPFFSTATTDSTQLLFYTDYDQNGSPDTVHYYLTATNEMSHTTNANDRMLYRRINSNPQEMVSAAVTDFKVCYYNKSLTQIPFDSLNTVDNLNLIRGVGVEITLEAPEQISDDEFTGISWVNAYYPSNLIVE